MSFCKDVVPCFERQNIQIESDEDGATYADKAFGAPAAHQ